MYPFLLALNDDIIVMRVWTSQYQNKDEKSTMQLRYELGPS